MEKYLPIVGWACLLLTIFALMWLVGRVLRAFAGYSCPEEDCSGTMRVFKWPHGPDQVLRDVLVCDRCGCTELLPESDTD